MTKEKKMFGQFFTTYNPFYIDVFRRWFQMIPKHNHIKLLEPFAGSNSIVAMLKNLGLENKWDCYDISPAQVNTVPEYPILKRDTIADFPSGYTVAITNPPYLAKNSATRSGLPFPDTQYDDLYKLALDVMLSNCPFVAAIIPESFISAQLFHNRLYACISLTCKMFEDTDCPVCLALFLPEEKKKKTGLSENDFFVYQQNKLLGKHKTLKEKKPSAALTLLWDFNDPNGMIGIRCIDNTREPSIVFVRGDQIPSNSIKVSSRSLTRVSGLPDNIDLDTFLQLCNERLTQYREETCDIFLTSFKGMRKDGHYRRRLDFANARTIINEVLEKTGNKKD